MELTVGKISRKKVCILLKELQLNIIYLSSFRYTFYNGFKEKPIFKECSLDGQCIIINRYFWKEIELCDIRFSEVITSYSFSWNELVN